MHGSKIASLGVGFGLFSAPQRQPMVILVWAFIGGIVGAALMDVTEIKQLKGAASHFLHGPNLPKEYKCW